MKDSRVTNKGNKYAVSPNLQKKLNKNPGNLNVAERVQYLQEKFGLKGKAGGSKTSHPDLAQILGFVLPRWILWPDPPAELQDPYQRRITSQMPPADSPRL